LITETMKNENNQSEISVEDGGDGFSLPSGFGIQELSLEHFRRCIVEGSREMNRGGQQQKYIKDVGVITIDAPNQREVFVNSVQLFHTILLPELIKNEELLKETQRIDAEITKEEKKSQEVFTNFKERFKINSNLSWDQNIDKINDRLERKKVLLSKKKLMVFSLLLKELNYFKEIGGSS